MKYIIGIFLACSVCRAGDVHAGGQTGVITSINVRTDGLHWITLAGDRGEMPACTKGHFTYWMIKDENSTYGKSQFSMLVAAYFAKKEVSIIGAGNCSRWGDGEDIKAVVLK